jgi:hypothetical protein
MQSRQDMPPPWTCEFQAVLIVRAPWCAIIRRQTGQSIVLCHINVLSRDIISEYGFVVRVIKGQAGPGERLTKQAGIVAPQTPAVDRCTISRNRIKIETPS